SLPSRAIDGADPGLRPGCPLFADEQAAVRGKRHSVGAIPVLADDGDPERGQVEPFDRDAWARRRKSREVERVLGLDVDRAFVCVDSGELLDAADERRGSNLHVPLSRIAAGCYSSTIAARGGPTAGSISGRSAVRVRISTPACVTSAVSSDLPPPVTDGFHATAQTPG